MNTSETMAKLEQLLNDYAHKEQGYTDSTYPFIAGYLFSLLSSVLQDNPKAKARVLETICHLERN